MSGESPAFSVVIAAHQAEATLAQAVESVLVQSRPPAEVVVCDDGSTDRTEAIARSFGAPVVVVRRKKNGGEAAAKNTAIRAAISPWVVILDADDLFAPSRLEALAAGIASRPDLDIVTTNAWLTLEGRRVRQAYHDDYRFAAVDQRAAILAGNFVFGLAAVRREAFIAAGGYDEDIRYATDWDLWMRMILSGSAVGLIPEPLAEYRIDPGNLSSQRAAMLAGRLRVIDKALERSSLSRRERAIAHSTRRDLSRRLILAEARQALLTGGADARLRSLRAAVAPGMSLPTRLKAGLSATMPGVSARRLRSRPLELTGGVLARPRDGSLRDGAATRSIAFYTDSRVYGGAEASLAHVIAAVPPDWMVVVIANDMAILTAMSTVRPAVRSVLLPRIRDKRDVRAIGALARTLASTRPNVLHVNQQEPLAGRYAVAVGRMVKGTRIVAVEHLPLPVRGAWSRLARQVVHQATDAHVGVGIRSARQAEDYAGLAPGAVKVIHNGVLDRGPVPRKQRSGGVVIGALGRLEKHKGYDLLLRSMTDLPTARLILAGDGSLREPLREMAAELGVAERVQMPGWLDDSRRLYEAVDLFVVSSHHEALPMVVLEAMLAALPIVATGVGSVTEAVEDGVTGIVVPPGSPDAIAAAIRRLAKDPDERHRMGDAGRAVALERFTADTMADAFLALYDEVLR